MLYMVFIAESAVHGGEGMYENSLFNNEEYSGNSLFISGKGYNRPSRGKLAPIIDMFGGVIE